MTGFFAWVLLPGLVWADVNEELYQPYQRLLSGYLIEQALPGDGLVSAFDYSSALADTDLVQLLEQQRNALAEFDVGTLEARGESVAFWINAYNFFMLEQILTERPGGELVTSVWDYGGRVNPFVDSVFDRENFVIGGERFSLSQIEKGVLLGEGYQTRGWKDARVHFAVNCASVGCPPLRDQVYTATNLEDLLQENTRRAFNTQHHLKVSGNTLYGTELFKWYKQDFVEAEGSVRAFIRRWASDTVAEQVAGTNELDYIDYDWSLNLPANMGIAGSK
ncbi:DUF547 domain-containing protein [Marinobacter sp. ANT_B65]|nr:DUF547 domain-containing protein [Marinobacter sp. ANT_B65]